MSLHCTDFKHHDPPKPTLIPIDVISTCIYYSSENTRKTGRSTSSASHSVVFGTQLMFFDGKNFWTSLVYSSTSWDGAPWALSHLLTSRVVWFQQRNLVTVGSFATTALTMPFSSSVTIGHLVWFKDGTCVSSSFSSCSWHCWNFLSWTMNAAGDVEVSKLRNGIVWHNLRRGWLNQENLIKFIQDRF